MDDGIRTLYSDAEIGERCLFHIEQATGLLQQLRDRQLKSLFADSDTGRLPTNPLLQLTFVAACLNVANEFATELVRKGDK